jgi:CRP/FNR family transcriptional regulator, cyclic AMP receptor protein
VPGERQVVRVLGILPELTAGLDRRTAEAVSRYVVAEVDELLPGCAPAWAEADDLLALVVLEGVLTRSVGLGARRGTELLGSGDVLRPSDMAADDDTLPHATSWRVLAPTRVAVLDAHFAASVARWPSILSRLVGLALRRPRALALQLAVSQVPRLEERLLLVLWQLADRFGHVEPGGVRVPLRLSQEVLSEIACARRPSVTVALKTLKQRGLATQTRDGWLLAHDSLEAAVARVSQPGRCPANEHAVAERVLSPAVLAAVRQVPDGTAALAS